MRTLIKNADVVFPTGIVAVSVLMENERIAVIDPAIHTTADETVDATGLHLLPGVIDDQVHFREPGLTHKEDLFTASRACAKGGVTTFLEMPNTIPNATTQELLDAKLAFAAEKSLVNYGFYIGATPHNLEDLKRAENTPGIKIFIGSSTGDLLVDDQEALERIFAETTLPITAHCEDESTVRANVERYRGIADVAVHSKIRDVAAATIATRRAIDLAVRHRHRFHVLHVSTGEEADILGDYFAGVGEYAGVGADPARRFITAEACPHHLLLNVDDYARLGTLAQMNPSLKSADDNRRLWEALRDGRIQVVATDHAPHTLEEKRRPYPQSPSGMPIVENSLALMLNEVHRGRCSLEQVVQWMCDAPARVWDIVDKGRIAVGYDADLVLVDLHCRHTIRNAEQLTKCGWSAWDGVELVGLPVRTWVRGREVYRDGLTNDAVRGAAAQFDHVRGGYWSSV
ncbi:MAG: dihydroorotase [Planctomycetaceae bacterium]|uniref:Allantoinase n=1 Tax=Lacipirellula limnantheis TaxID=2528024 RepID=A0A517TSP2_9BACT|nr:dihydroorotase [Lacipirellula limnantheis]MBL9165771.1 dihydroorotase [Planctomycetaceae bacterium]QDT71394.1 Allantoinase [Lacipirellula limnantheis]